MLDKYFPHQCLQYVQTKRQLTGTARYSRNPKSRQGKYHANQSKNFNNKVNYDRKYSLI